MTVSEVSRRKNTARTKLGAASQEEGIHLWKQHFKNLLWKSPRVTDEPITKIITIPQDIKLGFNILIRKIENRKDATLDKISSDVWKTRKFDDIILWYCNAVYNQNTINWWIMGCIPPFPKKGHHVIAKNYRGITLTSIVAKIYNARLLNGIELDLEKILR